MRGKYAESTRSADAYSLRILRVFSAYSPRIFRTRAQRGKYAKNARRIRGECAENTRQRYAYFPRIFRAFSAQFPRT